MFETTNQMNNDGNIIGNHWSVAIGTNQKVVFGAAKTHAKTTMAETALFTKP